MKVSKKTITFGNIECHCRYDNLAKRLDIVKVDGEEWIEVDIRNLDLRKYKEIVINGELIEQIRSRRKFRKPKFGKIIPMPVEKPKRVNVSLNDTDDLGWQDNDRGGLLFVHIKNLDLKGAEAIYVNLKSAYKAWNSMFDDLVL